MTPQDEAKRIFDQYYNLKNAFGESYMTYFDAKQCAMIGINEQIDFWKNEWKVDSTYWNDVKTELEKL